MSKRLRQQVVKEKNYGVDDINRLAVIVQMTEGMTPDERLRTFKYLKSRYGSDWPQDGYQ